MKPFAVRVGVVAALLACTVAIAQDSGPQIVIDQPMIDDASAFAAYMRKATAITPGFASGDQVREALLGASDFNVEQLQRGAVVYGAIAALQEKSFVAGMTAIPAERREAMADLISKNPWMVLGLRGAGGAAARVRAAMGEAGGSLVAAGKAVEMSAYEVQKQAWSKGLPGDRAALLAQLQTIAASADQASQDDVLRLAQKMLAAEAGADADPGATTPMALRSLTLAALAALGSADAAHAQRAAFAIFEPDGDRCLRMSKLNLNQCIAAAGPHYEDIFCLGKHVMSEVGQCMVDDFVATPAPPAAPAPAIQVADDAGVKIALPQDAKAVKVANQPE